MGYVAGKVQKIERPIGSGKYVEVQPGEALPECTQWPTFKQCLSTGFVVWMPNEGEITAPPGVPASAIALAHQEGVANADVKKAKKRAKAA